MPVCGYDAHTAMLLGVAKAQCALAREIKDTVRLIFPHKEELPSNCAIELMKAGVLDGVRRIFDMHVS
uniref:Putative N-acyl-L-amino acid amidohydrolase n=1 Tax=Leishmania guyanensis TaxID=5670 RepID=A0A1E1IRD5_LEIGU|nr:Putative N-acyl-L-amino acid amidohydrolase [Leishmania guyanensis]